MPSNRDRLSPGVEDSWWGVLMFNAFLSSAKAVVREAYHGLDSIPHYRFPDPFRRNDDE